MEKKIIPCVDITTILSQLNLGDETRIVTDAYYAQGHNGEFGQTAHFTMDLSDSKNPAAVLRTPAYTPFMLYGREPGKMPPLEPIESWMKVRGLEGSSYAIRKHIADFGTTGNDFLTPVLEQVKERLIQRIQDAISNAISSK